MMAADAEEPMCVFMPEILEKILTYLPRPDLQRVRLVCRTWSNAVTHFQIAKFTITFEDDLTRMRDFIRNGPNSTFCKAIHQYQFFRERDHREVNLSAEEKAIYKEFFVKFGPNIRSLTLKRYMKKTLVNYIYSPDIQPYLQNVTQLKSSVLATNYDSLAIPVNVEHLELANFDMDVFPRDDHTAFIQGFLNHEHGLKSCTLYYATFSASQVEGFYVFLNTILPDLFRTSTLKTLRLLGGFKVNADNLMAMTAANGPDLTEMDIAIKTEVEPEIFYRFLTSKRNSMRDLTLSLDYSSRNLLEYAWPHLKNLRTLRIVVNQIVFHRNIEDFAFFTGASDLETLEISSLYMECDEPHTIFQHFGLQKLTLRISRGSEDVLSAFAGAVPHCFPNLKFLLIEHSHFFTIYSIPIHGLQQVSTPGRSTWAMAIQSANHL